MSVGRKIRKWRLEKDLSQRAAARLIGVSQPTWRAVEQGDTTRVGFDVVARIVRGTDGAICFEDFVIKRRSIPPAA